MRAVEMRRWTRDEYERQRKGNLYTRNGIKEYWIINLNDRCVEAYRNPV